MANNTNPEPGQLLVSTRFMESYDLIKPVSGGRDLTPFANSSGNLDLYTVGTNNQAFRFRPQIGGKSSYDKKGLDIEAYQLNVYPHVDDRDNPNILGINADGKLTLSTHDAASDQYRQEVCQPPEATAKIKQMRASYSSREGRVDNVYVSVILEDEVVATSFIDQDGTWASRDWVPIKDSESSTEIGRAARIAICWNNPLQVPLYGIGLDQRVLFAENRFRFSHWTRLGTLEAVAITVVQDEENRLNVFAVDIDGYLWQKRQKQFNTSDQNVQWDDWAQINNTVVLASVRAVINAEGLLEIFGIGQDDILYHTRQVVDADGKSPKWGVVFPLGNPVPSSIFAVGRTDSGRDGDRGYSEAYSVTLDDQLYQFWQDPNTTQWYSARISIPEPTEMKTVSVHSAVIQLTDDEAMPMPGAKALLKTSNLVSLKINGLNYVISEFVDREIQADASGMIKIEYITNNLTAPTLHISTEFMLDGEAVTVQPNAQLQDKMYNTTSDDVWNARGADGQYLLQGDNRTPETAGAIAETMRQSMSLGKSQSGASGPELNYLGLNRSTTGMRYHSRGAQGSPFRIGPSQVEEQHWQVDFSGGGVRFHRFDRDGMAQLLNDKRSSLQTTNDAGFLGIEWGDVWNSVEEGTTQVVDYIVTTTTDVATGLVEAVDTVITLMIDGVEYLASYTVEFFQQAFDIVQGLWEKLKVSFKDLFSWLAFLFPWDDIQRTAQAMRHVINTGLDFSAIAVRSLKGPIKEGFNGIEAVIKKATDEFLDTINPEQTIGQYGTQYGQPNPDITAAIGHDSLLNGFLDYAGDADIRTNETLTEMIESGPLGNLVEELAALADNFEFGEGGQAFDEALAFFGAIGDNPDQILQLALSGVLKVMESVALFAVEAAEGVVLSIIDLVDDILLVVKELLNEEWEIPFVSQLWKLITGDTSSFKPIDLATTIIGVPATVAYQAATGEAPFPTDASVKEFEEAYTVQWLLQQAGVKTADRQTLVQKNLARTTATVETFSKIFRYCGGATWLVRTAVEPPQIITAATENPIRTLNLINVACRLCSAAFSTPWLHNTNAGGLSCLGTTEFNNLIWVLQVVFGPMRGGLLIASASKLGKKAGRISDATLTLWGAAHLGMFVALAVRQDDEEQSKTVTNILSTLGPQLLRFMAIPEVAKRVPSLTKALVGVIIVSYPTIAFLTFASEAHREFAMQPA